MRSFLDLFSKKIVWLFKNKNHIKIILNACLDQYSTNFVINIVIINFKNVNVNKNIFVLVFQY